MSYIGIHGGCSGMYGVIGISTVIMENRTEKIMQHEMEIEVA